MFYCLSYNAKRNYYKKHGECFIGYIVGADLLIGGRGIYSYHLKVQFRENNRKKILLTEAYIGDPNNILKKRNCHNIRLEILFFTFIYQYDIISLCKRFQNAYMKGR